MKKIIFYLSFLFAACSQSVDAPVVPSDTQISYNIAGQTYIYQGEQTIQNGGVGVFAVKVQSGGILTTSYEFSGNVGSAANTVSFLIATDTLKQSTYHLTHSTGSFLIGLNHVSCGLINEASDYVDVTITSYQNGIVNGSFSGQLTNTSTLQKVDITNGLIKNAHLHY